MVVVVVWCCVVLCGVVWCCVVLCGVVLCGVGTVERPKVVRTWCVFHILTSTCASRPSGVCFLNI